ncbi:MAG: hypothetical protein KAH25_12510 [Bacteroidales bacterium]|nr:hypothetical protein [Bacteroidales bacterium]
MKDYNKSNKQGKHFIGGIVVLTIGLVFLLKNFGILSPDVTYYLFSWKTLLIGVGILNIAFSENRVGGIILISLGTFFWLPDIFDLSVRAGQLFWPVVLIIIGIVLLTKKNSQFKLPFMNKMHKGPTPPLGSKEKTNTTGADEDYIDDLTLFSGSTKIMTTNNFMGGRMTAIFGGSELNLSRAKLAPGRNVLNVFFVFGGSTIIVPSNWNIALEATPIFGGFSDERYIPKSLKTDEGADAVLIIRGLVMFGGAEIKSY